MASRVTIPNTLPEIDWKEKGDGKHFSFDWGHFRIKLSQTYDYHMGPEDIGEGIDKRHAQDGDIARHSVGWHEYEYFRPANSVYEHYRSLVKDPAYTIEQAMAEASKYIHQDYERWEDYNRNEWCYTDIWARIYYQEVELAYNVVGGVESDSDGYENEVAWDELSEAIPEAIKSLKRLHMRVNPAALLTLEALLDAQSKAAYDAQRAEHAIKYPTQNTSERVPREDKDIPPYYPQQEDEYRACEVCGTDITTLTTDVSLAQRMCDDCLEEEREAELEHETT